MTGSTGLVRTAILAIGFLAITLALIILQPGPRQSYGDAELRAVTRTATEFDAKMSAAAVQPIEVPEAMHEEHAQRPIEQVLTDVQTATAMASAPVPARPAPVQATPQELRQTSWNILESLNEVSGRNVPPGDPGSLLHTIVGRALQDSAVQLGEPDIAQHRPGNISASSVPNNGEYLVRKNDTLLMIAQRLYGDPAAFVKIYEANRDQLSRPEDLRAGHLLRLPAQ